MDSMVQQNPITKRLARVSALLLTIPLAACAIASPDKTENFVDALDDVSQQTSDIVVSYCANSSSKGCWESKGNDQQFDFSFFNAFSTTKVFARMAGDGQGGYTWKTPYFTTGGAPLGYVSHPNGLPSNISSIATFSNGTSGTALMLGEDSKIYSVSGAMPPPATNGVDWANVTTTTPKLSANQNLCLTEIDYVRIPAPALAANMLGLGCDGKMYYKNGTYWASVSSHPGYSSLPTNVTFKSFSRMGSELGATFVTTANRIWLAGRGSFNAPTSTTTWTAAVELPAIKNSAGTTLTPFKVGGRYAITTVGNGTCAAGGSCDGDSDRIYWYDYSAGSWKRFTSGLPWYPQDPIDIGECRDNNSACSPGGQLPAGCGSCIRMYPYYDAIQQIGGAGASDFAVHHYFSWVYRWRKP